MSQLSQLLSDHPDWIAPRSDQHTVIGIPNTREHRKTFVEPGGSFSPGVATFGISAWLYDHTHARFFAPEHLPLDQLAWHWEQGYLPILNSRWHAGPIQVSQQLFATTLTSLENIVNTLQLTLTNTGDTPLDLSLSLVIRPYGPAGGKIFHIASPSPTSVAVNNRVVLLADQSPDTFSATSYARDHHDISVPLQRGELPTTTTATDPSGLCGAALTYRLTLHPNQSHTLVCDCFVHPLEHTYLDAFQRYHQQPYAQKLAAITAFWQQQLHTVQLQVPDPRFRNAYYSILAQFLLATVNHEVRITTLTYPLFWLRDGAYIINALDKAGLHEEVRQHLEQIKDRIFAGGFGAEPDAFGEAIWIYYTHYQLTRDNAWLERIYPYLKQRAAWIITARHTPDYLYADVEARVPANRHAPDTDLICEPARDGLIQGRMDWHRPLIWINAFAYLGLTAISELAFALGYTDEANLFLQEATDLHKALTRYAATAFAHNERDLVCAIWPTHAFSPSDPLIIQHFATYWQKVRLQGKNTYTPESLWKYFELGQAHNYLLLGERAKALQTVEHYLDHHDVTNLFGWLEDSSDIPEHWSQVEGWYKLPSRQPHGWVSSEFFLLLRDMLLYEDNDQLVIGHGIPPTWMYAPTPCHLLAMPTAFGPLDLTITTHPPTTTLITLHLRFHRLTHLPSSIILRLPWPAPLLNADPAHINQDTILIPHPSYAETGLINLTIHLTAQNFLPLPNTSIDQKTQTKETTE